MKKALMLASVPSMIEQFNMNNIKILQNMGYEVHVACNFDDGGTLDKSRVDEFKKELKEKNIIFFNIPFSRNPFSIKNITAYKETKKIMNENKYKIIHLHSPIGGLCGRLAARRIRKNENSRVIYTAHGFHFFKGAPALNWIIYYPIERWLAKYTDCLITINNEDYELAKNKFKINKIEYIPGIGVDSNKFNFSITQEEKHNIRSKISLEDDDFICIQVGELNKNKNQIMTLEAMRLVIEQYKDVKLLLVGTGNLEEYYREKIKEYNLEKNVFLLGYLKDVNNLLKISNLLISTSKREGLPVNIIEAMFTKLPVIATDCRGNRDLVVNGINGYIVKIGDVKNLKDRIIELKINKQQTKEFENYFKEAINLYSTKNIEKEILDKKIYSV